MAKPQPPGSSDTSSCLLKTFLAVGLGLEQFAMYSFCRGGTTDDWECRVDKELFALQGRWSGEAINGYIQAPILMRSRVTGIM